MGQDEEDALEYTDDTQRQDHREALDVAVNKEMGTEILQEDRVHRQNDQVAERNQLKGQLFVAMRPAQEPMVAQYLQPVVGLFHIQMNTLEVEEGVNNPWSSTTTDHLT